MQTSVLLAPVYIFFIELTRNIVNLFQLRISSVTIFLEIYRLVIDYYSLAFAVRRLIE